MRERVSVVIEEYLQEIYAFVLREKSLKAIMLSNRLATSPSTVHATLTRMQRDHLIVINQKKEISLTPEGLQRAETLVYRHRLVESFLCNKLGIPWYEVHLHAHVLEHGLTPEVAEKLAEFMGFPKSCPHGTPMPGREGQLPDNMIFLDQVSQGKEIEIIMIDESLEDQGDLMKFLHEKNLMPGKRHLITEKEEITQNLGLKSTEGQTSIPFDLAKQISVIQLT